MLVRGGQAGRHPRPGAEFQLTTASRNELMPIFQLVMQPSAESALETLQFIAADVSGALVFANQHPSTLPAELWQGGARMCRLIYSEEASSWTVADQGSEIAAN